MAGINFTGLASGIDSDSIVRALMQLEARPITRLQQRAASLEQRQGLYSNLKGKLQAFSSAANALSRASTFNAVQVSTSDSSVARVTAAPTASPGVFDLEVRQLAQAARVSSAAQSDASSALGLAGEFTVNGKVVSVVEGDSLTSIAQKINGAGGNATASLINGGPGSAFLTISGTNTGQQNALSISDLSGGVAEALGLVQADAVIRHSVDGWARSLAFESESAPLGMSSAGTFSLGGQSISFDFSTDSLQSLAERINTSGGAEARVTSENVNGQTRYFLEVRNTDGTPLTPESPSAGLEALGVLQRGFTNSIREARDALYSIDGFEFRNATNTVDNVIQGVTITLQKGTPDEPQRTTISLAQDNGEIRNAFKNFIEAYNSAIGFIRDASQFDPDTFRAGPLFGDANAAQIENQLANSLFRTVQGGPFTNLAQIGVTFGEQGRLQLDEAALDRAISQDRQAIRRMMESAGTTSNADLRFISGGNKTVASGPGGYAVEITQLATKASVSGAEIPTAPNAGGEILTFSGSAFGGQNIEFFVDFNSTAAELIEKVNNDSRLRERIEARLDDEGRVVFEARRFGSQGSFSVVSNLEARADNSGIGSSGMTVVEGVDVQGTINGEAATGNGRTLTGNFSNPNTSALQFEYTGTELGAVGSIVFTRGVASGVAFTLDSFTDAVDGLLTINDRTITDQLNEIEGRIRDIEAQLQLRERNLRERFTAMERAIAQSQQQMQQFAAAFGAMGGQQQQR